MSEHDTLVSAQHFAYIAERTNKDDAFLLSLREAAVQAGIPSIAIGAAQASFMQILLKLARAKDVIEVGTLAGYSAITMARALPEGGSVRTIELIEAHAKFAKEWADKPESGAASCVKVFQGAGTEVLPSFEANSADAAFLDADKGGYAQYLRECMRIVRPGGLIMVDNAFAFGELFAESPQDRETAAVRAFNEIMAGEVLHPSNKLQGIICAIGDGMWVAVKS